MTLSYHYFRVDLHNSQADTGADLANSHSLDRQWWSGPVSPPHANVGSEMVRPALSCVWIVRAAAVNGLVYNKHLQAHCNDPFRETYCLAN